MSAATLAELSDGRFVLGLGSSSHAIIEDWNGVRVRAAARATCARRVAIVRQALAGGKTDFEGKTFRSHGFRLGNAPQRPVPIYLAALREKMLALAGEIGDGADRESVPGDGAAADARGAARRRGARRARRDALRGRLPLPGRWSPTTSRPRAAWCASPSPATSRSPSTTSSSLVRLRGRGARRRRRRSRAAIAPRSAAAMHGRDDRPHRDPRLGRAVPRRRSRSSSRRASRRP